MFGLLEQGHLHPRVRAEFKWVRLAVYVTAVFLILAVVAPYLVLRDEFQGRLGMYFACLVLPQILAGAVVWGLVRYWIAPKFRRMSEIMNRALPRRVLVEGKGLTGRGRERAELFLTEQDDSRERWKTVWVKTPNEGLLFKKGELKPAEVYEDESAGDGFIVIDTGQRLLWGEVLGTASVRED